MPVANLTIFAAGYRARRTSHLFKTLFQFIYIKHYQIMFNGTLIAIIFVLRGGSDDRRPCTVRVKPPEIINNPVDDGLYVTFIPV